MDLADIGFPLPLVGKPVGIELEEEGRFTDAGGAEVIEYLGSDGCRYRETRHRTGQVNWQGFRRDDSEEEN